ncbi:EF-hand domain-containing protein [Sphingosinicella soli]|uniref:Ca2+-binding EF-hand superfamily protein n=1 Tax=Sphingosinicella soli TaxID=333708 RepID=A0A7W7AZ11_9SPHN|nr:EF-hand domain-containing protein [Sphingosinicella soli]MBB4630957.1 Ca2+-binding EF-hand superfamily protein [Sphingosinicella soli]
MTRRVLIALAAATLVASPAAAQRWGGGDGAAAFDKADADGDGVVTRSEFLKSRSARFDTMDRNNDGVVSESDFKRILKFRPEAGARLERLIAEADANRDGKVTRAEFDVAPTPVFDLADTNGDGKVDRAELETFRNKAAQAKSGRP